MSVKSKFRCILKILNAVISESFIESRLLKTRNRNPLNLAQKIHGRHPEDYIYIDILSKLNEIEFHDQKFPIQPDVNRMLDSIYGPFDFGKMKIIGMKILI